jgi:uncharacterized membrane protein YedE/YeeE
MPDFIPLIDTLGEPLTIAGVAFVLAFLFGFLAERSGFCTRSAVLEIMAGKAGNALVVWLAAFGSAILFVQAGLHADFFSADDSRFFSGAQSLSGPLIGGAVFGIGMALARGCSSRLLVLGATGNLRALTAIAFMAVAAYATLNGFLVPVRDTIAGAMNNAMLGGNDMLQFFGSGATSGIALGLVLITATLFLAVRYRLHPGKVVTGMGIGALFAGGWIATHALSGQFFDPIAIESLSFVRPASSMVEASLAASETTFLTLDSGLLFGIVTGAFVSAIAFKSFRIQRFSDDGAPHFLRYGMGGSLMGFGGVLAGGCTVGAGFSGGSLLAFTALLALASMIVASALTELALRRLASAGPRLIVVPAE